MVFSARTHPLCAYVLTLSPCCREATFTCTVLYVAASFCARYADQESLGGGGNNDKLVGFCLGPTNSLNKNGGETRSLVFSFFSLKKEIRAGEAEKEYRWT